MELPLGPATYRRYITAPVTVKPVVTGSALAIDVCAATAMPAAIEANELVRPKKPGGSSQRNKSLGHDICGNTTRQFKFNPLS